jgi:hypothetical protein
MIEGTTPAPETQTVIVAGPNGAVVFEYVFVDEIPSPPVQSQIDELEKLYKLDSSSS